jgi:hypothetical protein
VSDIIERLRESAERARVEQERVRYVAEDLEDALKEIERLRIENQRLYKAVRDTLEAFQPFNSAWEAEHPWTSEGITLYNRLARLVGMPEQSHSLVQEAEKEKK